MDKDYEKKYHDNEYSNWWFVARRNAILKLLKNERRDLKILDIGCAGGPLIGELNEKGFTNVYGIDYSEEAVQLCKSRGFKDVFLMDAHNPEFPENYFDIIIASDSLEHLEKDEMAIGNWYRILKPNGKILVFVPSFMSLWSEHDTINMHYRRYTRQTLSKKIREGGFKISKACYWNFLLFFPAVTYRVLQRLISKVSTSSRIPENQLRNFNPLVNFVLKSWIQKIENPVFVHLGLPVGVSVFISATK